MPAKYRIGVIASGRIAREHTEIAASAENILLTSVEKLYCFDRTDNLSIIDPMTTAARIAVPVDEIADFCRRNHIRKLSLFGSVLRDDFGPASDVDVLVEFDKADEPGLIAQNPFPLRRRMPDIPAH